MIDVDGIYKEDLDVMRDTVIGIYHHPATHMEEAIIDVAKRRREEWNVLQNALAPFVSSSKGQHNRFVTAAAAAASSAAAAPANDVSTPERTSHSKPKESCFLIESDEDDARCVSSLRQWIRSTAWDQWRSVVLDAPASSSDPIDSSNSNSNTRQLRVIADIETEAFAVPGLPTGSPRSPPRLCRNTDSGDAASACFEAFHAIVENLSIEMKNTNDMEEEQQGRAVVAAVLDPRVGAAMFMLISVAYQWQQRQWQKRHDSQTMRLPLLQEEESTTVVYDTVVDVITTAQGSDNPPPLKAVHTYLCKTLWNIQHHTTLLDILLKKVAFHCYSSAASSTMVDDVQDEDAAGPHSALPRCITDPQFFFAYVAALEREELRPAVHEVLARLSDDDHDAGSTEAHSGEACRKYMNLCVQFAQDVFALCLWQRVLELWTTSGGEDSWLGLVRCLPCAEVADDGSCSKPTRRRVYMLCNALLEAIRSFSETHLRLSVVFSKLVYRSCFASTTRTTRRADDDSESSSSSNSRHIAFWCETTVASLQERWKVERMSPSLWRRSFLSPVVVEGGMNPLVPSLLAKFFRMLKVGIHQIVPLVAGDPVVVGGQIWDQLILEAARRFTGDIVLCSQVEHLETLSFGTLQKLCENHGVYYSPAHDVTYDATSMLSDHTHWIQCNNHYHQGRGEEEDNGKARILAEIHSLLNPRSASHLQTFIGEQCEEVCQQLWGESGASSSGGDRRYPCDVNEFTTLFLR